MLIHISKKYPIYYFFIPDLFGTSEKAGWFGKRRWLAAWLRTSAVLLLASAWVGQG